MLTQVDQVKTETFVARLVGMYHHWVLLLLTRRVERRRADLAVVARNDITSPVAVADAYAVPTAERYAVLWDHTAAERLCAWTPARPALQQGAAGHITYPAGSPPRLALSTQAPDHLQERC